MPRRGSNRSRPFRSSGSRANRTWSGFASVAETTIAASSKVLIGGFTLSNTNIDETILRTRGRAMASPVTTTSNGIFGAWGMCVVTDLAVAAGAASIPGPITDREDDLWYVWQPIVHRVTGITAVGTDFNAAQFMDFDSKAMRRVQEGQQIVIMVENASASTTFRFSLVFRMLSMLTGTGPG